MSGPHNIHKNEAGVWECARCKRWHEGDPTLIMDMPCEPVTKSEVPAITVIPCTMPGKAAQVEIPGRFPVCLTQREAIALAFKLLKLGWPEEG